jgi:hypothetical protein
VYVNVVIKVAAGDELNDQFDLVLILTVLVELHEMAGAEILHNQWLISYNADFLLVQFVFVYYFQGVDFLGGFFNDFENVPEFSAANFFQDDELVYDRVFFQVLKVALANVIVFLQQGHSKPLITAQLVAYCNSALVIKKIVDQVD